MIAGEAGKATVSGDALAMVPRRQGHFQLESGHHGNFWLDLDTLFLHPGALAPQVSALAKALATYGLQAVCGPLVGGAFVAQMVAAELDLSFCYAERLVYPGADGMNRIDYRLPAALGAAVAGKRVAVIDDAINAGSAVGGTLAALRSAGAIPIAVAALLDLADFRADPPTFDGLPLVALGSLPARLWMPEDCPLCGAGIPLDPVASD